MTAPAVLGERAELRDNRGGIRSYPIDHDWRRGAKLYVARVTLATGGRFTVERDFARGKPVKARGAVEYGPASLGDLPSWVVRRHDAPCGDCGQPRPISDTGEDLIAAYASGWQLLGVVFPADLGAILEAGPPGAPGSWSGETCDVCMVTPIIGAGGETCEACLEAEAARGHLAALPETEVF